MKKKLPANRILDNASEARTHNPSISNQALYM